MREIFWARRNYSRRVEYLSDRFGKNGHVEGRFGTSVVRHRLNFRSPGSIPETCSCVWQPTTISLWNFSKGCVGRCMRLMRAESCKIISMGTKIQQRETHLNCAEYRKVICPSITVERCDRYANTKMLHKQSSCRPQTAVSASLVSRQGLNVK